ncbi:MAG: metallophosphoesterase family protein [Acidobacteriota bacterium]
MAPHAVKQDAKLPEGTRRIACVADTHGSPHARTAELLRAYHPDAIIHAGDIGELGVLEELRAIAPVYAVRGNIDTRVGLPDHLVLDAGTLKILVTHIAVAGPRLRADAAKLARDEHAQLVVCGHSHVPFVGSERGITVFNPGSVGPRRFTLPIVFGTIELADRVRFAHIDCETGKPWSPP